MSHNTSATAPTSAANAALPSGPSRCIDQIPDELAVNSADLKKVDIKVDEHTARDCFKLLLDHDWLTKRYEKFLSVWYECEDADQRQLVKKLMNRFLYISHSEFLNQCTSIASAIKERFHTHPERTWIVAAAENNESDGSHIFVLQLRDSFGEPWEDSRFISRITSIHEKANAGDSILVVDDFIGSGTKALRKMRQLRERLEAKDKSTCSTAFIAFAGMQAAELHLRENGVNCYIHKSLTKGITDQSTADERTRETDLMKRMEEKLSKKWKDKELSNYSFGFKGSESLYYHEGRRIPNNVFPFFWWALSRDHQPRNTLFPRPQPK